MQKKKMNVVIVNETSDDDRHKPGVIDVLPNELPSWMTKAQELGVLKSNRNETESDSDTVMSEAGIQRAEDELEPIKLFSRASVAIPMISMDVIDDDGGESETSARDVAETGGEVSRALSKIRLTEEDYDESTPKFDETFQKRLVEIVSTHANVSSSRHIVENLELMSPRRESAKFRAQDPDDVMGRDSLVMPDEVKVTLLSGWQHCSKYRLKYLKDKMKVRECSLVFHR